MAHITSTRQQISDTMKHPNTGKITGYNSTNKTMAAQLFETMMAVYARLDSRDPKYDARTPYFSKDRKSARFGFVLPKNATIGNVCTFSYKAVKNVENSKERTYVVSSHVDSTNLYQRVVKNSKLKDFSDSVDPYFIEISRATHDDGDFFPYVIDWTVNDSEGKPKRKYQSCLCFFKYNDTHSNMSDFVARYLTNLCELRLGNVVVEPIKTSYTENNFKVGQRKIKKMPFEHPQMTKVSDFQFRDLDYLMLPSMRTLESEMYIASMNDFTVLKTYVKYLAATRAHFFKVLQEEREYNDLHRNSSSLTHLYGTDNSLYTIDYTAGMESPNFDENRKASKEKLIMIGIRKKPGRERDLNIDINAHCYHPAFNRMIFGSVSTWHSHSSNNDQQYHSYGFGCISKYFIESIKADDERFWEDLTHTDFKDSIFNSIIGYTSNDIDDMLFADSSMLRSKAANNSSYADAVILHYDQDNSMNDTTKSIIRSAIAGVYRAAFSDYIDFLYSGVKLNQFNNPVNRLTKEKNYKAFVRILQFPQNISSLTHGTRTETMFGATSHEDSATKLSYTVSTEKYFNSNFYQITGETDRVRVHSRCDGGIFMATDNINRALRESDSAVLRSPYSYPARKAFMVSDMLNGHVDFFLPSVITTTRKTAAIVNKRESKTVTIYEISQTYPERVKGPQLDPSFHQQKRGIGGVWVENSKNFAATPAEYPKEIETRASKKHKKETITMDEMMNVKRMWIDYVKTRKFINRLFNRTDAFIYSESDKNTIEYTPSHQLSVACYITADSNCNIFELIEKHEKEAGPNDLLMTQDLYNDLCKMADLAGFKDQWKRVRDALKGVDNEDKRKQIIKNYITETELSNFYSRVFKKLHTNYVMNTNQAYRITRLNNISTALITHMKSRGNKKFEFLELINAYLLITDFGTDVADRSSYYKKEHYMALSASVYISKLGDVKSTYTDMQPMTFNDIINDIKDEDSYDQKGREIIAIPLYANIANVPMFKHTDRTYIHLLNEMCSVNSNNMYYFIKCLANLEKEDFRFDLINGFAKRQTEIRNVEATMNTNDLVYGNGANLYNGIVSKIRDNRGEEVIFRTFDDFMNAVRGSMMNPNCGKHRAATNFILDRVMYDRSFLDQIEPVDEIRSPKYESGAARENPHIGFRTFYLRGTDKTVDIHQNYELKASKNYIDNK